MDPSLKNKQALFEQLDACGNCDEKSDTLSPKEEALRQQCKAFYAAATTVVSTAPLLPLKSRPKPKLPHLHHRRTTSETVPKPADDELEIIAVTPRVTRQAAPASSSTKKVSFSDSVVPDTDKRLGRQKRSLPNSRLRGSRSDLAPSPSVSMAKRKRDKPLQMASESAQIFRGLCFFYIPNDDINPARRLRITKAREHGAVWVQSHADATHVVVDKGLSYDDIKSVLGNNSTSPPNMIVNDQYPIECLRRGVVFDPNQTVEKYQYKVPGDPGSTKKLTKPPSPTQDPTVSLQLKPRKSTRLAAKATPESTQRSGDLVPSSYPDTAPLSRTAPQPNNAATSCTNIKSCVSGQTLKFADELVTCIDAVLDDPEKHEYLDVSDADIQVSEDEGSSRKSRSSHKSKRNDVVPKFGQDRFMCMKGGVKEKKPSGPNAETIRLLEEMAEEHNLSNETWRVQSYRKAVATLRRQPKKIKTAQEAAVLTNIGSSIAEHIEEIATTGRFGKLDQLRSEPSRKALRLFCNIYGVGVSTATRWVELGYRTLDDLRSKATLTTNQQIGLDHFDDLLTRIPRAEVKALGDHVKDVAATIDPKVELIIGGSYRRGAESSGDVDLIITKNGTSSAQDLVPFLDTLVDTLTKQGFLTAALASHRHDGGNKWHGCCVLPETATACSSSGNAGRSPPKKRAAVHNPTIWRRIDLLLVPQTEIGAALVYFTGNDLFNRSMRLLARKKKMKLNHRALSGVGVHEGRDEKKIFEILGVQWREPHERWC